MARDWALCKLDKLREWDISKVRHLMTSYLRRNGWRVTVYTSTNGSKYIRANQGHKSIRIRVSDHAPRADMRETFDLDYWFVEMVDTHKLQQIVEMDVSILNQVG